MVGKKSKHTKLYRSIIHYLERTTINTGIFVSHLLSALIFYDHTVYTILNTAILLTIILQAFFLVIKNVLKTS